MSAQGKNQTLLLILPLIQNEEPSKKSKKRPYRHYQLSSIIEKILERISKTYIPMFRDF